MLDFLMFEYFISIKVLIIFYYMGAIILPIGGWYFIHWVIKRYHLLAITKHKLKNKLWPLLSIKQRLVLIIMCVFCFLLIELFWRIMFEFLIAYMQMRDALVISHHAFN